MTGSSRVFKFWSCPLSTQQSQFRLSYPDTSSHIVSTYKSMLQEAALCICLSVSWVLGTGFILCHSLSYRSEELLIFVCSIFHFLLGWSGDFKASYKQNRKPVEQLNLEVFRDKENL